MRGKRGYEGNRREPLYPIDLNALMPMHLIKIRHTYSELITWIARLQAENADLRAERIALNELLLEMAGKLDLVEETMKESECSE